MDVTEIPFNKYIGISHLKERDNKLTLIFKDNLKNHLGTFHASAQFSLAEACSGKILQTLFPHLLDSVVPVLRKTETKFKKAAQSNIIAKATVTEGSKEKFENQFQKKGRAVIPVMVDIIDENENITMSGIFEWFIQKI